MCVGVCVWVRARLHLCMCVRMPTRVCPHTLKSTHTYSPIHPPTHTPTHPRTHTLPQVDLGVQPLYGTNGETVTQGIDNLAKRCTAYYEAVSPSPCVSCTCAAAVSRATPVSFQHVGYPNLHMNTFTHMLTTACLCLPLKPGTSNTTQT